MRDGVGILYVRTRLDKCSRLEYDGTKQSK